MGKWGNDYCFKNLDFDKYSLCGLEALENTMSIIVCEKCDAYIDSDFDADCFVELGNMRRLNKTHVWCERCRDEYLLEEEAKQDAADAACALAQARDEAGTISLEHLKKDLK